VERAAFILAADRLNNNPDRIFMWPGFSILTDMEIALMALSFCLGWAANDTIKNWWRKHQFFKQLEQQEKEMQKWLNN
jgi:hypothetical protein